MGGLTKYDKNRAISVYESSRELTSDGVWVTRQRRYEEYTTAQNHSHQDVIDAEVLRDNKHTVRNLGTSKRNPEKLDNISFMVLMNSMCVFFLLLAVFIQAIFSI